MIKHEWIEEEVSPTTYDRVPLHTLIKEIRAIIGSSNTYGWTCVRCGIFASSLEPPSEVFLKVLGYSFDCNDELVKTILVE